MAVYTDLLSSPVSGSVGEITFQETRTPRGNRIQVRRKPFPSNPNTPKQLGQRARFANATAMARAMGPGLYRGDWDNIIGTLVGFSYMVGRFNAAARYTDTDIILDQPVPDPPLGALHQPGTINLVADDFGVVDVNWTKELGSNGSANDLPVGRVFRGDWARSDPKLRPFRKPLAQFQDNVRSDGFLRFSFQDIDEPGISYFAVLWFRPDPAGSFTEPSPARFLFLQK